MKVLTTSRLESLIVLIVCVTTTQAGVPEHILPQRLIYQFTLPTYLESLYVRENGDLYVSTVHPNASIYSITGATNEAPKMSHIHTFDIHDINGCPSIIETQPDVLTVICGLQTSIGLAINGTFGVWELDLRPTRGVYGALFGRPSMREVVRIPGGGLLSVVERLPGNPTTVLVSDATMGLVWRVDTLTGQYEVAMQAPHMEHVPWSATPFGINGIHVHDGYLYWSHSYEATIYRIAVTSEGYAAEGARTELVKQIRTLYLDNFNFGPAGGDTMWAAANAKNRVYAIDEAGNEIIVAGRPDSMSVPGPVTMAFGKLVGDTDTLYVATGGGLLNPINGTTVEGGKIIAIDTRPFLGKGETVLSEEL